MGNVMRRGIMLLLCLSFLVWMCAGCQGGTQENVAVDLDAMAEALINSGIFNSEMKEADTDIAMSLLPVSDQCEMKIYIGDGIYSDEIVIITAESEEAAEPAGDLLDAHLKDLRHSFEDYLPEETAKIDRAVQIRQGCYLAMCISNDEQKAKEIMDTYFAGGTVSESGTENAASGSGESSGSSQEDAQTAQGSQQADGSQAAENSSETAQSSQMAEEETIPALDAAGELKSYGSVVTVGNAAYELYTYLETDVQNYADAVNRLAAQLDGTAVVYDMVIPLSSGITLPDAYYDQISSSNQETALNEVAARLSDQVKSVAIYNRLMVHRDEYIYFRTDHHWTALGAYYAYEEYCQARGISPIPLEAHETVQFDGFLGSFYTDTNQSPDLGDTPDYILAYYPVSSDVTLTYTDTNGNQVDWPVISNVSNAPSSTKYSTFAAGDNPYTIITNASLTDGSACLVVKESFGNALIPFLADNYQTVHVIDYRYWTGNLADFVQENGVQDVLLCNNMSVLQSGYLIGKLTQLILPTA